MSYRVEFGGGAQAQFHSLPEHARDALYDRQPEPQSARGPGAFIQAVKFLEYHCLSMRAMRSWTALRS